MNLEPRENRLAETHWRQCSRGGFSSESRPIIILPRPMKPVVSPHGSALAPPANRNRLPNPVRSGTFSFSPVLLFNGSLFSSLASTSSPPRLSTVIWPFCSLLAVLSEGGQQRKLEELNYEPAIVVTAEPIWQVIVQKGRGVENMCPK